MKQLTIAIPAYNAEAYLRKCLESMLAWTRDWKSSSSMMVPQIIQQQLLGSLWIDIQMAFA